MAAKKKSAPVRAPLSPAKRRLFTAITIALPFLLLGAAEVTLRFFGWGGYPAWIREAGKLASGDTLCLVEPAASKPYFFANPTRPGYAEQTNFVMPKPKNTVRIFLVGESAAKGYPQPRNLAMSSFLQAMLSDAWPEKKVEVINLGTTAVASFPLVYQVRDALRFSPDLFILHRQQRILRRLRHGLDQCRRITAALGAALDARCTRACPRTGARQLALPGRG